ncbi:MAG: hypothetical protein V1752_03710, partial [Candidatus Firestonebacteria bacterium]
MQILQKKEAVKAGWELTKKHLGFAIITCAVYIGISAGFGALQNFVKKSAGTGILSFNIMILEYLVMFLLTMGLLKIFMNLYDGKKAGLSVLFSTYEQYF